jgi:hypothetical protein
MLTQILQISSLLNQPINLGLNLELLSSLEILARELFLDSSEDLNSAHILYFLRLLIIESVLCKGRGAVAWTICVGSSRLWNTIGSSGVVARFDAGHNAVAAFGGEVWLGWGFADVEAPVQERIVDELYHG